MEKWIEKLFNIKRFPGQLIFVIWASCLLFLFLPEDTLKKYLLFNFKNKYGEFIGPIFIITSIMVLVMVFKWLVTLIKTKRFFKRRKKSILKSLKNLNSNEIAVLREFVIQGKTTILARLFDETVVSLENKGIIYVASKSALVNGMDMGYPYSLSQLAIDNLTHSDLRLPRNLDNIDQQTYARIMSERPQWARDIERNQKMWKDINSLF